MLGGGGVVVVVGGARRWWRGQLGVVGWVIGGLRRGSNYCLYCLYLCIAQTGCNIMNPYAI